MSHKKQGQGLVEYIILVGLIALLVFGLVKAFGDEVGDTIEEMTDSTEDVGKEIKKGRK
tara:strand:+ start:44824 stop:45000 length:177 start_codon:yes stop_codon:yes gene_type:complete